MELKGKKLLVIGGAGLIGSHTVEMLCREDVAEIIVYDSFVRGVPGNLSEALKDPRVRVYEPKGEILQTEVLADAMRGVDGVFHFAALWLLHCHDFPRSAFDVNIKGTFNVMDACVREGVKRLVYSSSASVYGDAVSEPMTEEHPFNNKTFYGATKIAGEAMLRAYHHRYGLDFVGLRYMNVYGPRQDDKGAYVAVIIKMLNALAAGEQPVVYGDGSQAYDFVHVQDCGRANVLAMAADTTDEFYNVGTGVRTSIAELAALMIELSGVDSSVKFEPGGTTFVRNRIGCPKKAAQELGFEANIGLREGLMNLISAHRSKM